MSRVPARGYTTRVLRATALIEATKHLLREWDGSRPEAENLDLFRRPGALVKTSHQRTGDLLAVLRARYLEDAGLRRALVRLAQTRPQWPTLELVLGYHASMKDDLLFDFAADFLYSRRLAGVRSVSTDDAYDYLRGLGLLEAPYSWSSTTVRALSVKLLTAWRDYGLLRGKAKKTFSTDPIPTSVVVWIATDRAPQVPSAMDLAEHRAFRLLLLTPEEVERHLRAADTRGWLRFQGAGTVARLDLTHHSIEDLANALA